MHTYQQSLKPMDLYYFFNFLFGNNFISLFFILKIFYLFLERGEGREENINVREKHWSAAPCTHRRPNLKPRQGTSNLLICWTMPNQLHHTSQGYLEIILAYGKVAKMLPRNFLWSPPSFLQWWQLTSRSTITKTRKWTLIQYRPHSDFTYFSPNVFSVPGYYTAFSSFFKKLGVKTFIFIF